ncbi:MAG: MFS transporter [Ruminococcaceae bacterium]|nr:MFS transporter [Oscillospiraceae bacterium]
MKKKFNYTWVIIAICFLSVCTSLGFASGNRSMYFRAINDVFSDSFSEFAYSFTMTIRYIATTTLNIFFGCLVNKFGTKKLLSAGFISLTLFALISSFATNLIHFYIAGVFLGIGLSWTTTTMMSVIVNTWVTKNKGTVMGAVLAANGLGGAVAAQIVSPIIFAEGEPYAYRNAYRLVAIIMAVMLILILIFFREAPKNAERTSVTLKKNRKIRGSGWVGMDFSEVKRKPYFYLALICMLLTGMSLNGMGEISSLHMYDIGMSKEFVASLATVSSLLLMSSKFLNGFMYDRIGIKKTMNLCYACAFISLGLLALLSNTPIGKVLASIKPIFSATALPLETVMISLFANELFGNKSFNKVVGLFAASTTAGFALASPFSQLWKSVFGNYTVSMIAFAILMIFVTVTMQFVLKCANRDKKTILEALEREEVTE